MTFPLVSILLPVFNAEKTLSACLQSVQRQSESRWECIIVDDGSSDGSLACARRFAGQDSRFLVLSMPHRGLVAALQLGLPHCRGTFIARMDADDLMHRHRLALQIRYLESHPALAAAGCHVRLFPRHRLLEGLRRYERWLNSIHTSWQVRAEAFVECPIAHPTLMIRRPILLQMGYRDCGWPEDYDLVLRLLIHGYQIGVVPYRLLSWRDHPHRLSRTGASYALERFTACKAAFLASSFLATTDRYILWGYGATGKALRRALLSHGKIPSYIVELHPGRVGKRIHDAPVIWPAELVHVPRHPIVVAVAGEKARSEIRECLVHMGFREVVDFVCTA
ncbi:MAG: glycosyltransferase [Nitrospinota bacterium]|nr:MAG: glycosyltransferase [Nitrospinota bacterium]